MVPFGKQQEILRDLSTSSPEELSGNCRRLFIEEGVVVITNEKSACGKRCSAWLTGKPEAAPPPSDSGASHFCAH
jgi:hypothetical protein